MVVNINNSNIEGYANYNADMIEKKKAAKSQEINVENIGVGVGNTSPEKLWKNGVSNIEKNEVIKTHNILIILIKMEFHI